MTGCVAVVGIYAAVLGVKLLKNGYLGHPRKVWRSSNNMDVKELGYKDGRRMAYDRAQLCRFWC
jgi:hypothetical protein